MMRASRKGVTLEDDDWDVSVDITVEGDDEDAVERVMMHTHDQSVRAMEAINEQTHPDDVAGIGWMIDWSRILDAGGD